MAADFGGPDRDDAVDGADTDAADDTPAAHPGDVHGGGLEDGAKEGPEGAESDGFDAAHAVGEGAGDEGADKGSAVIDGDDTAEGGDVAGVALTKLEKGVWLAEI